MPTNEERREVARRLREKYIERNTPGYFEVQDLNFQALNYLKDLEACVPDGDSLFTVLADLIEPEPERTCEWMQDEDGNWHTSCGDVFIVCNCESLEDNKIFHCFKCGGIISVVQ